MPDAVVVGTGPNGLVAANLLADAGWDVVAVEAAATPGGGVRSAPLTAPGFVNDVCSAFYPMAGEPSPLHRLGLTDFGLRWRHAPAVLAHLAPDLPPVILHRDLDATAASVDSFAPGDGQRWRELYAHWQRVGPGVLDALFTPFPPVRPAARLVRRIGPGAAVRLARQMVLSVGQFGREWFRGQGGPLLMAGCALHTDLGPADAASGSFGWLLTMLGQQRGFPVPEGGAQRLTDALVARLAARGGTVVCDAMVDRVVVGRGRALGVGTRDGRWYRARRAVLADVAAPSLYLDLVGEQHLPGRLVDDVRRIRYDHATVKVDWAGYYRGEKRHRVVLPTYPFERQRYWVEAAGSKTALTTNPAAPLSKKTDVADWFYVPSWKRSAPRELYRSDTTTHKFLICSDECGVGSALAAHLTKNGHQVTTACLWLAGQPERVPEYAAVLGPRRHRELPDPDPLRPGSGTTVCSAVCSPSETA